jgi:hypothetical protein
MKFRSALSTSSKPGTSSHVRVGRVALVAAVGLVAAGRMVRRDLTVQAKRREPDAATDKMFTTLHRNRKSFSASELNKAFAKAKAEKVG